MMHIKRFRKLPVVIEAVQYTKQNAPMIAAILREWGLTDWHFGHYVSEMYGKSQLVIRTLEGEMICKLGDYIVKGIKGEFYVVDSEIFEMTYERVHDEQE